MRMLVCGGRDFDDWDLFRHSIARVIAEFGWPETLIHGMARGADEMAADWAKGRAITVEAFPADWETHGRAAGPIRNQQMLDTKPDIVVAFPGGCGTADLARRAKGAGIKVIEVKG